MRMDNWMPDQNRLARPEVQSAIKTAQSVLGHAGRMMSGSKSGYANAHPANVPVFNGNLVTENLGKIWYGDIDLTLDGDKIQALSIALGEKVYVLREMAARFENENSPKLDQAVVTYDGPNLIFGNELKIYGQEEFQVEVCKRGRNAGKIVYKKEYRR